MWWIVGSAVVVLLGIFVFTMAKSASDADDNDDRAFAEYMKEFYKHEPDSR